MKKLSIMLLGLLLGSSIQSRSQSEAGFSLTGKFKGLPDGSKVYLRTQENDTVSKAISKGDQFIFKGALPLNGRFHFIVMDTAVSKLPTKAIFLLNKPMTVLGVVGRAEITVSDSPEQKEYTESSAAYINIRQITDQEKLNNNLAKQAVEEFKKKKIDSIALEQKCAEIQSKLQVIEDDKNHKFVEYIKTLPPTSLYIPWLIKSVRPLTEREKLYEWLSSGAKSSYYGVQLRNSIESDKLSANILEGAVIPNFSITNLEGKQINVLDVAANSKYTLIDCWASWCKPCRAEVPELKKIYNAFKNKGLNILGVSSDKSIMSWKKAVAEDGTAWLHGLESKEMPVGKLFDLKAIPAYILIDNKGKLIAFDSGMSRIPNFGPPIRGEGLHKTLETLLTEKSN